MVTYTDEFTMVSHNPVMCPVLYNEGTVTKTHSESTQTVIDYDVSSGGFYIESSTTAMALADGSGMETYSFTALTDAFTRTMPFKVYLESCTGATVVAV